jgi:hypothetical protein
LGTGEKCQRKSEQHEIVPLLMRPSKSFFFIEGPSKRLAEEKRYLLTMNLQLMNPDRAPHGVHGRSRASSPEIRCTRLSSVPLGQVVHVPTADGTTHCHAKLIFRSASQVNWPEAVTVRADALSLSKAEEPVAGYKT